MAIKKTIQAGNPILRQKALAVKDINSRQTKRVVTDLVDTMRSCGLVGMAAPQIGKAERIIVVEVRKSKTRKDNLIPLLVFINPRIITASKKQEFDWEGCGSIAFAGIFAKVKRPTTIEVEAFDQQGSPFRIKAQGLLARVIQHEIDHLDGILFTDKADLLTLMEREEYKKMKRALLRK